MSLSPVTRRDAETSIDLLEGETILHVTGRHVVLLLARLLIPAVIGLSSLGLAIYRAVGGGFISQANLNLEDLNNPELIEQLRTPDLFNGLIIVVLVIMLAFWAILSSRDPRRAVRYQPWLLGIGLLLTLIFYYRYRGGQLFYIDQFAARPFDAFNIVLYLITLGALVACVYTFFDWANDELILTNQRVIYDNDTVFIPRLIEKRVQDQIPIEDIQNVVARTESYPQHFLNYGTIVIQSSNAARRLVFQAAGGAAEMQAKIMAEVRKMQSRRSEESFHTLIEARVYNNKPPAPRRQYRTSRMKVPPFLRWVFEDNPRIDEEKGNITWYPHWLYLLRALAWPVGVYVLGALFVIIAARTEALTAAWSTLLAVLGTVIFVLWAAWEIEDYRNDLYILTPTSVTDIDKKPFGPEDRRTAGLGAIVNVSFQTTFISNLLGYGDVFLETAGAGGKFTFHGVPRPREVVATINDYLAEFRKGEKERALNDTLTLLRHYHDAQIQHKEIGGHQDSMGSS